MGSSDPFAVLPVSTLSFAFGADFVSAGFGVDFVSAGFGCVEVLGTTPILICAIPDKGGARVGLLPAFDVADFSSAMHVSSVCVCASVHEMSLMTVEAFPGQAP